MRRHTGLLLPLLLLACCAQGQTLSATGTSWSPYVGPSYPVAATGTPSAAFYYPWYCGSNWDGRYLQMTPAIGRYDSRNLNVMATHMRWARQAHLSMLIVSWWGLNNDRGLRIEKLMPDLMRAASTYGIRLLFMIELYPGRTPAKVASDIAACVSRYQGNPGWYTATRSTPFLGTSPKPVFFIDRPDNGQSLTPAQWTNTLKAIHANSNAVVLAHNFDAGWVTTGQFDGLWDYSYTNYWDVLNSAHRLPANAWYVPTACPGFDALRSKGWTRVLPRYAGDYYDYTWNKIIESDIDIPMASVTSFNEWFETTQIEPATAGLDSDGFLYETYVPGVSTSYLAITSYWSDRLAAYQAPIVTDAKEVYLRFNSTNRSFGIYQYDWGSDGNTELVSLGGKPARRAQVNNRYLYLQVNRKFLPGVAQPLQVRVDYYDQGTGNIYVQYNSTGSDYQTSAKLLLTNTKTWRTAYFVLPDARFRGTANGYSDLRLAASTGLRPAYALVAITKL